MILTKLNRTSINIDSEIDQRIKSGKLNEILFIVPTNRKSRYLLRELISFSPNFAAKDIKIDTIGSLSQNLLSANEARINLIKRETSVLLIDRAFRKTKLKYFSQYRDGIPFGTLERVMNVISEYKRNGIIPMDIINEIGNLEGTEKNKAIDIANIFTEYQKILAGLKLKDIGDVYSELNGFDQNILQHNFYTAFADVNFIYINGFDEFSLPEVEIINKISELKNIELYISFDYYNYNPSIFSHLDICYDRFIKKGFKEINDLMNYPERSFIEIIKKDLFRNEPQSKETRFKNSVTKITARNREEEVELICKEVKELIINQKISPSDICVVINQIGNYSALVRDRFNLFEIPFNLTDRFSLSTSNPVIAIINFLEIEENDFYYKNIFRALNSSFIHIADVNLSNLLKVSVKLRIISGLQNWQNIITDAINELKNDRDSEDYDWLDSYRKALEDLNTIERRLEPFKNKMSPKMFYINLSNLVSQLDVAKILIKDMNANPEKDIKAFSSFMDGTRDLCELLNLEFGDKEFSLKYYISQIKTSAAFTRYNVKEKPGYGVQITNLNEIRGLQFEYLFIAGLNDGDLPTRFLPEIFFSGSFIEKEERYQTEERYHFYQSLCAWKKGLYLSHPISDTKRELVESSFLKDFENIFEMKHKTSDDYKSTIYAQKELTEYAGKIISGGKDTVLPGDVNINLEKLKNSIDVDKKRIAEPFSESSHTGFIGTDLSESLKEELASFSEKQYSVTQLETYAKCPYKFFVERILNLEVPEEPTEELEAFELGSILHKILYEFYVELKKEKITLQNCSNADFKKAEQMLFKIANQKFDELHLVSVLSFFDKEKIIGINGNKKNSILYKFLEHERNQYDDFLPSYFEFGFGKFNDDNSTEYFEAGKVKVRGKIDRVDMDEKNQLVKVVDYKSGSTKPTIKDLYAGLSLQLPLYLYAAKKLISAQLEKDFKPAGMEIYSLKYSESDFGKKSVGYTKRKKAGDDSISDEIIESNEELIKTCIDSINKYVDDISKGKFHLSTLEDRENKVCWYCNFRSICRIQEVN